METLLAELARRLVDEPDAVRLTASRQAAHGNFRAVDGTVVSCHGCNPEKPDKGVSDIAEFLSLDTSPNVPGKRRRGTAKAQGMDRSELEKLVVELEEEMFAAAEELRFEYAAKLRDEIRALRRELDEATAPAE